MVPHDRAVVVDEAAAVAGEQTSAAHGVEVTPRVDAVPAGHAHSIVNGSP